MFVKWQLLECCKDYLRNQQQRVVVFGKSSNWLTITSGVPQGLILAHCNASKCKVMRITKKKSPYSYDHFNGTKPDSVSIYRDLDLLTLTILPLR